MAKTIVKYRTFDDLMNEVKTDFFTYEMEGMIEPSQLIKIAQKVNYDLGLRIHSEKQRILDVVDGKVKLPDDFYVLSMALLCAEYQVREEVIQGRHTENVVVDATATCCNTCGQTEPTCCCDKTYTVCENTHVKVVERRNFVTKEYTDFRRLRIRPSRAVDPLCSRKPNGNDFMDAELRNGFLYIVGIDTGKVYLTYLGNMEDDEGNLLVLDHPMVNEYYEYAIKQRILENLYMNGEDVSQKISLIEGRLRPARNNALSMVNTPDFQEMHTLWKMNREAMYAKYYDMFKSYYINL